MYDLAGRATARINPMRERNSTVYDAAGQVRASVNALGYLTSFAYDRAGRRIRLTDPREYATTFLFDAAGQDIGRVDPLLRRTTFGYDQAGRRTLTWDARNLRVTRSYDPAGQLTLELLPAGVRVSYAYDRAGRRTAIVNDRQRVSTTYDAAGQVRAVAQGADKRVSYVYDDAGRRGSMQDPDGGLTYYARDDAGQLVELTSPQDGVTAFTYDGAGREWSKQLANGVRVTRIYDPAGQLRAIASTTALGGLVRRTSYAYDDAGRRQSSAGADGARTTWAYDVAGQLLAERRTGASPVRVSYAYDPAGNRAWQVDAVAGTRTTYTHDAANELAAEQTGSDTTVYVYDAAGNRAEKSAPGDIAFYAWDALNRLAGVELFPERRVSFAYDGDGRRVSREADASATRYVWDFQRLLQEADGTGATERQYLSTDDQFGNLVSGFGNGQTRYYEFDATGSTDLLLDNSGGTTDRYQYTAFGLQDHTAGADPQPLTWVGKLNYIRDNEVGLYFLGAGADGRSYDPAAARFLSRDPAEEVGGHPNPYLYCANDPVNNTDPSGKYIVTALTDEAGLAQAEAIRAKIKEWSGVDAPMPRRLPNGQYIIDEIHDPAASDKIYQTIHRYLETKIYSNEMHRMVYGLLSVLPHSSRPQPGATEPGAVIVTAISGQKIDFHTVSSDPRNPVRASLDRLITADKTGNILLAPLAPVLPQASQPELPDDLLLRPARVFRSVHQPPAKPTFSLQGWDAHADETAYLDAILGRRRAPSPPPPTEYDVVLRMIQDRAPGIRQYIDKKPVTVDVNWVKSNWQKAWPFYWLDETDIDRDGHGHVTSIKVRANLDLNKKAALIHLAVMGDDGFKTFAKNLPVTPEFRSLKDDAYRLRLFREYEEAAPLTLRKLHAEKELIAYDAYDVVGLRSRGARALDVVTNVLGPSEVTGSALGSGHDYLAGLYFGPKPYTMARPQQPTAWGARIEPRVTAFGSTGANAAPGYPGTFRPSIPVHVPGNRRESFIHPTTNAEFVTKGEFDAYVRGLTIGPNTRIRADSPLLEWGPRAPYTKNEEQALLRGVSDRNNPHGMLRGDTIATPEFLERAQRGHWREVITDTDPPEILRERRPLSVASYDSLALIERILWARNNLNADVLPGDAGYLLRPDPRVIEVLEERFHMLQRRIDQRRANRGMREPFSEWPYFELQPKDLMIRYQKLLGLSETDVAILEQMKRMQSGTGR